MGDVVNLRQARKRAGRQAKEAAADANRAAFGISKTVKDAARKQAERGRTALDSHRLDRRPEPPRDDH